MTTASNEQPDDLVSNGQPWSTGQSMNNPLSWADVPPVNVGTLWTDPTGGDLVPVVDAGPRVDLGNGMSRELIAADVDGQRWETWAYRARRGDVLVLLPVAGADLPDDPAAAAAYDDMMRTMLTVELDRRTHPPAGKVMRATSIEVATSPTDGDAPHWRSLMPYLAAGPSPAPDGLRQARYRLRWQMVTPDEYPGLYDAAGDRPIRSADRVPADCWRSYVQHHIDGGLLLEQWAGLHQAAAAGEYIRDVRMFEHDQTAPDGWREIDAGGPTP